MKLAVVVGHRKGAQGAVATSGVSEWRWNTPLAAYISAHCCAAGLQADVVYRPNQSRGAITALVANLNAGNYAGIVSLHFNATASHTGTGHLVLHHPASSKGRALAEACSSGLRVLEPTVPNKGLWPTTVNGAGTELYILTRTYAPAALIESHFGDRADEHQHATDLRESLGQSISSALVSWADSLVS